jgi:hypothetical protein
MIKYISYFLPFLYELVIFGDITEITQNKHVKVLHHISVEKNYKSYLSFFGKPEVNRADLSCIFSLREN